MARPTNYDIDEVIENASILFWAKGYKATSVDNILKSTGLNKHSLYLVFGGKQALFLKVLKNYQENMIRELFEILEKSPQGTNSIKIFFDTWLQKIPPEKGCLIVNSLRERAEMDDSAHLEITRYFDRLENGFYQNLKVSLANKEIDKNTDIRDMSRYIALVLYGAVTFNQMGKPKKEIKRCIGLMLNKL